jgi:predicted DNA-binding transcriptional regulator AlpA
MTAKQKGHPGTRADEQRSLDRLIFRSELIDIVGVSYVTVWSWMRAGTFPRGRDIGGRTAWIQSEVADWIASRPIRRLKGDEPSDEPESGGGRG